MNGRNPGHEKVRARLAGPSDVQSFDRGLRILARIIARRHFGVLTTSADGDESEKRSQSHAPDTK
ncbi:MAG: hypothetical protein DDT32_01657 [Syntrophomonadaceae bacterium]|nr:hypothetical protein [Bacillota bacterium]